MADGRAHRVSDDDLFLDDTRLAPGNAAAAILVAPGQRYLLQLRDRKRGIFFPGRWGCFGGAIDAADATIEAALVRELREELGLEVPPEALRFFTHYTFDMSFCGGGVIYRTFYELPLSESQLAALRLAEGSEMRAYTAREALTGLDLVPYDEFALWMHASRNRFIPAPRA